MSDFLPASDVPQIASHFTLEPVSNLDEIQPIKDLDKDLLASALQTYSEFLCIAIANGNISPKVAVLLKTKRQSLGLSATDPSVLEVEIGGLGMTLDDLQANIFDNDCYTGEVGTSENDSSLVVTVSINKNDPPPLPSQNAKMIVQAVPSGSPEANQSNPALVQPLIFKEEGLVVPRNPPRSIGWVTFWAFIWPGLGQLLCGQSTKGGVLMLVCLITCGLASATVIIPLVICILSAIDARKVAIRLANQKTVGVWEFFPQYV
jgi:TM2 domain-containing membrane protein YozV